MISNQERIIADLHIHSRFSRACSKNTTIPILVKYAKIKGLNLLGTGDFTHPIWLQEIKQLLKEKNNSGLFYYEDFPFVLSGEISLMYTQGKGRRIHLVLLAPSLDVVGKINSYLDSKGRRDYDGRPIFKISCEEFAREMNKISEDIEVIPAHIWTPHFGIFGSKSGFDSLKEAFGSEFKNIHAIETGMSSSPRMNWQISELNSKTIISFSDSHSFWPWRLGREATIFNKFESYSGMIKQIHENSFIATVETDPAYGIYHWDGHRDCKFSSSPEESKKLSGICPICKKPLTIGVENRVEELTDQDIKNARQKFYYQILPLHEIISLAYEVEMQTKKSWETYNNLIGKFENEFNILLNVPLDELLKNEINEKLARLIIKNRLGKIKVKPGFDGQYGKAVLEEEQKKLL